VITPLSIRLSDSDADRVRQSHAQAIAELQSLPVASLRVIRDVVVASGNSVTVAHGLGRAPVWVGVSAVRWDGAAFVASGTFFDRGASDANGNPIDRTKVIVLAADGFTSGGSVVLTVDLAVM
jgi:hypothetical protein